MTVDKVETTVLFWLNWSGQWDIRERKKEGWMERLKAPCFYVNL